ncbi:hypothetical protein [Candidatus Xianfuyuplasma coldseepsis]|uniref:Uncharacterized protein n=1 Tax=Candidatus Xianfuyuplasma coldseepsis TaxID=2782163 RepID=A0A7L7KSM0_9MOLU|nr:hypothetical protein [Xianfuyuplasma coldseepsis]QMS85216.1 hypothetical protein G4Z02_05465 [Xianfuyuplasma coldseepsis]
MKRWIITISFVLVLIIHSIEPVVHAATVLGIGRSYGFAPATPHGGGQPIVSFGSHSYPIVEFMMMIVMFCCITFATVASSFHIHRYYLLKNIKRMNLQPYLRVTKIGSAILVASLFLAFLIIYSLWYVVIVGLITQAIGLAYYIWKNNQQGHPIDNHDIHRAFIVSASTISLVLMLFLK